jgi:hypothetical protein
VFFLVLSAHLWAAAPSRQEERFLPLIAELRTVLEADLSPGEIADLMVKKNSRISLFRLEGLCRLYEKRYPYPMEEYRETTKGLEDILGWYADTVGHITFAQKLGAPPAVMARLAQEQTRMKARLVKLLVDEKWIRPGGRTVLDKMQAMLAELDWDSVADDRAYLRKRLNKHLKKIEQSDYDMEDLQEGLHELRRHIRWFLLYVQGLNGAFVLDESQCPVESYRAYLKDPLADSGYTRLKISPREKAPIKIPKCYFVALTRLSEDFGVVKDLREAIEDWLPEAFLKSGAASSMADARAKALELVKKHQDYKDLSAAGHALYRKTKRRDLIPILRMIVKGDRVECHRLLKALGATFTPT